MTYDKAYAKDVLGADCDNCPLRVGGRFVPSVGPEHADVAFVGEAPGIQEAREGVPFIGPSGKLLQIVNNQYGLKREEVFLTNACLCRPADGTNPPKAAIGACRKRLHTELRDRGTSTVVGLGNSSALSLLGIEGVTKLRVGPGRASPYEDLKGMRIIPTVHPAACLRQSDMFPSLVADIGKVVTPNVLWVEPEYTVLDDPVAAVAELERIEARAGDLVVDIEVDIEKDTAFDHPDRYGLLCVGLCDEEGRVVVIGERACQDDDVRLAMANAFAASNLDAQNGKFDLAGLHPVVGTHRLSFDTMLANYCLDERPGVHGLKHQAVEHLGAPQYDEEIKKYVGPKDGYGVIPRELLYKYNAYDVYCTWLRKKQQVKLLETKKPDWWESFAHYEYKSLRELHDFLVEASNELIFPELNGIAVDRDYANELTKMYTESLGVIEKDIDDILVAAGYNPINPRSPKQVKEALAFFKITVSSTNEETLKTILERTGEKEARHLFVAKLLVHRRETKMYGTYVKGTVKRMFRGRVYPTFLLHGTTTGRLSCRNPNLQNVPRESAIKQLFVPGKPENVFVQADFGQAELRVLTWLARDEYFRGILNDPSRDLFDELTPILYPELPSKDQVPPELWKDIRVRVKAFVYGLGYGRTAYSIAMEYKLDEKEASAVTRRFFSTIPDIVQWQKDVKAHVKSGRDLISPFGRHRRFHLITDDNWKAIQNEALAFLPQSTSSDICLRAMVRVRRDLRGSGAYVRNIVHDSILVDTPADMASDISSLLDRRMVESARELVGDYVMFKTDVHIGKHWGEV